MPARDMEFLGELESPFLDEEPFAEGIEGEQPPPAAPISEFFELEDVNEESPIPQGEGVLTTAACLKGKKVAVVGAGLAGLMAARHLAKTGVNVDVYEARSQVGGRVLSNRTFSKGRIIEEGAELIGSFHTEWLKLARQYGIALVSRMDEDLYERAGLKANMKLDKPPAKGDEKKLTAEFEQVLSKMAGDAMTFIRREDEPWRESPRRRKDLIAFDNMSVASALKIRYGVKEGSPLWSLLEWLLVNNEVASLEAMNFLGLLCKVRGGQTGPDNAYDDTEDRRMGYWTKLEIFRCADGCDKLATEMAAEIKKTGRVDLKLTTAVTEIKISKSKVEVGSKSVVSARMPAKLAAGSATFKSYDYVILAIPPSVWYRLEKVTFEGRDVHPKDKKNLGLMATGPAIKFFSNVKERFWIKKGLAPLGGSSNLGQVWEGTDNQTRLGDQGIVLSVFAGPIIKTGGTGRRAPNAGECANRLKDLYEGNDSQFVGKPLHSDWPAVPFIETGYVTPALGQVFGIGRALNKPYHERLFFAGEHAQMAHFGYMEGALRSGLVAAGRVMLHACGLLKEPTPDKDEESHVARLGEGVSDLEQLESPFLEEEFNSVVGERKCSFLRHPDSTEGTSRREFERHGTQVLEPELDEPELFESEAFDDEFEGEQVSLLEAELGVLGRGGERRRITNTLEPPCRWVCQISLSKRDRFGTIIAKKDPAGTGVLISPRHVLTAAHVLHSSEKDDRGFRKEPGLAVKESVEVTPARNGGSAPLGSFKIKSFHIHPNWDPKRESTQTDYAIITLERPIGDLAFTALGGKPLCHWGNPTCGASTVFDRLPAELADDLVGRKVVTAGYPGKSGQLYLSVGTLSAGSNELDAMVKRNQVKDFATKRAEFSITADATKGQSGSPVWIAHKGKRFLVGIISKAGERLNTIVNANNDDFVRRINEWMSASPTQQPELEVEDRESTWTDEEEAGGDEANEFLDQFDSFAIPDDAELELTESFDSVEAEEPELEEFVPKVSKADLQARIDAYLAAASAEYTLPGGAKVNAPPQFRYAAGGDSEDAKKKVAKILGQAFEKSHPRAIHMAAYGRPTPSQLFAVTQALIEAGEFAKIKTANAGMSNKDLVRKLQRTFRIGIDCAGYVQLAFIHAYTGSDSDPPAVRKRLGLHEKRGWERLENLPAAHFEKKPVLDAQTGDLLVFKPRAGSRDWHTVIVVDHTVSDSVHTFLCDASWGVELYDEPFGGVARRELKFDADSGEWWDVHPGDGSDAHKNTIGPYKEHPIHGLFRPKQEKAVVREIELETADDTELESPDGDEAGELFGEDELAMGELDPMAADLAEKTMAHETAPFEHQTPGRWTKCFSKEDVARVQAVFDENSAAAKSNEDDRCSCIVMLNVALGRLLGLNLKLHPARSTRNGRRVKSRRVQMGNLTTKSIEKAMAQLRAKGFAVAPTRLDFEDRRGRRAGTLEPVRLTTSVRDAVLSKSQPTGCWFAYGLSIMDGHHSVLLLLDRTGAKSKIYWLDQFSSGFDVDVTNNLDQRLTEKTQQWWRSVMEEKKKGYDTTIRLWPLRRKR